MVDDLYVHEATSKSKAVAFGRSHKHRSQAGLLAGRIDREQAEVGSVAAGLDVNATNEEALVFSQQKRAAAKEVQDVSYLYTITFNKESLSATKGGVDYGRDLLRICWISDPQSNRVGQVSIDATSGHLNFTSKKQNLPGID